MIAKGGIKISYENVEQWKYFMKKLVTFLELYRKLLDSYVADFFSKDLFATLNSSWVKVLGNLELPHLSNFVNIEQKIRIQREVLPLSLLSFRASCSSFSLTRKDVKGDEGFHSYFSNKTTCKINLCETWKSLDNEFENSNQSKVLHHIYRMHLKPKKQHEVRRLSHICSLVQKYANADLFVDVGSGQGHLARLLSYGCGITTVCIDGESDFVKGAEKFDLQLEKYLKRHPERRKESNFHQTPIHRICHINENLTKNQLNEMFKDLLSNVKNNCNANPVAFGMVGLHTCGNLSPILMRTFCALEDCVCLLSVGCCYMKLTKGADATDSASRGYPMSKFVHSLEFHSLSYNALEVACHAIEAYSIRLHDCADNLKVHCYRSVLEEIIISKRADLAHYGLRPVKNAHQLEFKEYAIRTLSRLIVGEDIQFDKEDFESDIIESKLERWMQVVIFYSLRLMLAPVVETLILIDRLFYIFEHGHDSLLVPLFEPSLSPRNFVLLATKNR